MLAESVRKTRSNKTLELLGDYVEARKGKKRALVDSPQLQSESFTLPTQTDSPVTYPIMSAAAGIQSAGTSTGSQTQPGQARVVPMPSRHDRKAPRFDGDRADELIRFIKDVEECFSDAGITDDIQKKDYLRNYADTQTSNEWTTIKTYKNGTWDEFVSDLISHYPEAVDSTVGTFKRLDNLCKEYQGLGLDEFGRILKFLRRFAYESNLLLKFPGCTSNRELVNLFFSTVSSSFRLELKSRLMQSRGKTTLNAQGQVVNQPLRHPSDPHDLNEVLKEAESIARDSTDYGGTRDVIITSDVSPRVTTASAGIPPKFEQMLENLSQDVASNADRMHLIEKEFRQGQMETLKAIQGLQRFPQQQWKQERPSYAPPGAAALPVRKPNVCHYCNAAGHFMRDCEFLKDHMSRGLVKHENGNVRLSELPREPPTLSYKDRVDRQGQNKQLYMAHAEENFDEVFVNLQTNSDEVQVNMNPPHDYANDAIRVLQDKWRKAEQEKAQWQNLVLRNAHEKQIEQIAPQFLNAQPSTSSVNTKESLPVPNMMEQMASLMNQMNLLQGQMSQSDQPGF